MSVIIKEDDAVWEEQLNWHVKEANGGRVDSMYELGLYFAEKKNWEAAVEWHTKAAEGGKVESMYALGNIYNHKEESMKWFHMAADKGHVGAKEQIRLADEWDRLMGEASLTQKKK